MTINTQVSEVKEVIEVKEVLALQAAEPSEADSLYTNRGENSSNTSTIGFARLCRLQGKNYLGRKADNYLTT